MFLDYLKQYNRDIQPILEEVFDKEKKRVSGIVSMAGVMAEDYKHFVEGGKKLRGTEILLGYEMFGGRGEKQGLLGSLVIEIIHSFLLMHDDFMDQDTLRRGEQTMHKKYAEKFGDHYGQSLAINLGDEGCFFAMSLLNSLDLPRERLSSATQFLGRILFDVGIGQALDITFENEKEFLEGKVLKVHRYKTAEYTVPGPLTIGAILAGVDDPKVFQAIKDFGIPVGIAFQIRDDELGMFSTEEELGKPVDSDIKEGKLTILIVKAMEEAGGEDLEFLKTSYGKKNLSLEDVEKIRQIIKDTGALEYSQKLSKKLVDEGKKFIPEITNNPKYQQLLSELADFVILRKS